MRLYLFNPDTDLALAANAAHYMAPASARQMAEDLALLPAWYAEPGSGIVAASAYNADFLKRMRQHTELPVHLITEPELPDYADSSIMPWGWNPALCKRLCRSGIKESALPSPEWLSAYRAISSRNSHIKLLNSFQNIDCCIGEAYAFTTIEDCHHYAESTPWCLFKAPWSGSGKGLQWCYGRFSDTAAKWCGRILREQGSLIASPIYNKVKDFAMEFHCDGRGTTRFIGYSCFHTNEKGAYLGNALMTQDKLEGTLTERYLPRELLLQVQQHLQEQLTSLCGETYCGYIGVDMMICREREKENDDTAFLLHPCVEINLRMNMGVLSCLFAERYLAEGSRGTFSIRYYSSNEELKEELRERTAASPAQWLDGRLQQGFLPLVPTSPRSRYLAYVEACPDNIS